MQTKKNFGFCQNGSPTPDFDTAKRFWGDEEALQLEGDGRKKVHFKCVSLQLELRSEALISYCRFDIVGGCFVV